MVDHSGKEPARVHAAETVMMLQNAVPASKAQMYRIAGDQNLGFRRGVQDVSGRQSFLVHLHKILL